VLKEILNHTRQDTANEFVINGYVRAVFAMADTETAADFDASRQIVLAQETFYNFGIDVISAGKTGTSHANGDNRIRFVHLAAPGFIV
jgi:hypothetical protein